MSESQRDAVWEKLPARLSALSVRVRLLPWIRDELVNWARDTLVARQGAWTVGEPDITKSFACSHTSTMHIRVDDDAVVAECPNAAFRLAINEKVRAFSFSDGGPIVLGLPRGRATLPLASTIQPLGPDAEAIRLADRNDATFDIGMGLRYTRCCVRTNDPALKGALEALASQGTSTFTPAILDQMTTAGAHLVVESAAARIEIYEMNWITDPPSADLQKSQPDGNAKLDLPSYAVPVAAFQPL